MKFRGEEKAHPLHRPPNRLRRQEKGWTGRSYSRHMLARRASSGRSGEQLKGGGGLGVAASRSGPFLRKGPRQDKQAFFRLPKSIFTKKKKKRLERRRKDVSINGNSLKPAAQEGGGIRVREEEEADTIWAGENPTSIMRILKTAKRDPGRQEEKRKKGGEPGRLLRRI